MQVICRLWLSFVGRRIVIGLKHLFITFSASIGSIIFFSSGCKLFTESFLKGLAKTSGSNYGQEKSDWEPRFTNEKLGNFAASETRLVEILDGNQYSSASRFIPFAKQN